MITLIVSDSGNIREIKAEANASLFSVLNENGYNLSAYCGGNGTCGKCKVNVNGDIILACNTTAKDGDRVGILGKESSFNGEELLVKNGEIEKDNAILAIDIGTTTIAVALFSDDLTSEVTDVVTSLNPQIKLGADVLNRIKAVSEGKLKELQSMVISEINRSIDILSARYSIPNIKKIVISGNTTMLHLLQGVDCTSMGQAPYTPIFLEEKSFNGKEIGLPNTRITQLCGISSFVGSDIVGGIFYVGEAKGDKVNCLIDLGTNAEIAIWDKDKCLCTAAAAGPCFEGANISCGINAVSGAISKFKIEDGKYLYETIGGEEALGICGTGLVDIVSALWTHQIIDENGTYEDIENFEITEKISVTQKDIREFQLAKSAIRAAFETLLSMFGKTYQDIENLYLAGGFSSFIDIENAIAVGLLPSEVKNKCLSVANSSLKGAIKFAKKPENLDYIIKKSTYVDLTKEVKFTELFVEFIGF